MNEEDIVTQLRQSMPLPNEPSAAVPPPPVFSDEQSSLVQSAINELAILKLGNSLGVVNPDEKTGQYLRFIYETALSTSTDTSYEAVLANVDEYLLRLGLKFREDRFMKLYLWMKLNQERLAIEQEMTNVRR
jgi:hypothetical protein